MSDLPSFLRPSQTAPPMPGFLGPSVFPQAAPVVSTKKSPEVKQLLFDQFELAFPRLIDRLYSGETINAILKEFPIAIERGAFMRWIKKDAKRFALFTEAKETRTEIWTGEMVEIARGAEENPMELDRAKFLVDTYKWLIQSENKKGYGKSTQIEVSGNISLTAALAAAETRVELVTAAVFEDDDEPEPTMKQLSAAPIEAEWEEADDDE